MGWKLETMLIAVSEEGEKGKKRGKGKGKGKGRTRRIRMHLFHKLSRNAMELSQTE